MVVGRARLETIDLVGLTHIDRGVSDEVLTTSKTARTRRVGVGVHTAAQWNQTVASWQGRGLR